MTDLLGYREIVEKCGTDLDEIFYVTSFVRLQGHDTYYSVTAHQSGNGRDYSCRFFDSLDDAQKAYDTMKGVLAYSKAEVSQ